MNPRLNETHFSYGGQLVPRRSPEGIELERKANEELALQSKEKSVKQERPSVKTGEAIKNILYSIDLRKQEIDSRLGHLRQKLQRPKGIRQYDIPGYVEHRMESVRQEIAPLFDELERLRQKSGLLVPNFQRLLEGQPVTPEFRRYLMSEEGRLVEEIRSYNEKFKEQAPAGLQRELADVGDLLAVVGREEAA